MGVVVFFWIAPAVQPASHPQPADLDSVFLEDDGLPGGLRVAAGADEEKTLLTQMFLRFAKSGIPLIEYVIIGEGDHLDAAEFQSFQEMDRGVELKRFRAARMGGCYGSFQIDETEIGLAENVGHIGEEKIPAAVIVGRRSLRGGSLSWLRGARFEQLRSSLTLRRGSLHHRNMRDNVAGSDKGDAADFFWVGNGRGCSDCGPALLPLEECRAQQNQKQYSRCHSGDSFSRHAVIPARFFAAHDPKADAGSRRCKPRKVYIRSPGRV